MELSLACDELPYPRVIEADTLGVMPTWEEEPPVSIPHLVELACARDREATDRLSRYFEAPLRAHVRRSMGQRVRRWNQVDGVTNRVLAEGMSKLSDWGPLSEVDVLRRLKQLANWRIRQMIRDNHRLAGDSSPGAQAPVTAFDPGAMGSVTHDDFRLWLRRLIGELPPHYASAVELCSLEGLSFVDAGKRLGVSPDCVRSRLSRAFASLRRRIPPEEYE